jgi:hypothetical protein
MAPSIPGGVDTVQTGKFSGQGPPGPVPWSPGPPGPGPWPGHGVGAAVVVTVGADVVAYRTTALFEESIAASRESGRASRIAANASSPLGA